MRKFEIGAGTLIIIFAIIAQIVTGMFLIYAPSQSGDVPRMAFLIQLVGGRERAGFIEVLAALIAALSFCWPEHRIRTLLLLVPQQTVFLISLGALATAIASQHLGGIYRPWQYIVVTQLYTALVVLFHSVAILLPAFGEER